jgi:predicted permease
MPDWKAEIGTRLANLKLEPAREAAIIEELTQYLDDCHAELLAAGATEAEAYRQTLTELDGSEALAHELRRAEQQAPQELLILGTNRRTNMIADLWQDLRYAARGMRKHAVLSAVVVITLTLGIGISSGVFTMINALVLRARVDKDPDTFVRVFSPDLRDTERPGLLRGLTVTDYLAFRDGTRSLRDVAACRRFSPSFEDDPSGMRIILTTDNYFSLYTAKRPRLGRFFQPADFNEANPVAVLSERMWRDRLESDPEIVGKVVHFNRQPVTVIGIAPPFANTYSDTAAWLPYTLQSYLKLGDDLIAGPDKGVWEVIEGRLNPGFSRQDAAAELALLNTQQDRLHQGRKSAIIVTDGSWVQQPDWRNRMIWVIFLIMGTLTLIVVIACANVTTLLLARAHSRQQEIAVRLAFGAAKLRLIRMLFAETLLLAAAAGAASVYVAYLIPDILNRWLVVTPFDWPLTPDWRVFGYLATLTLIAGTLSSLAPALQSLKVNLSDSLKGRQSLFGAAAGRGWPRGLLIGTQVAVSLVLLAGAGLFVRAHQRVAAADFGFETRQTLAAKQEIHGEINAGQSWAAHHRDLAERVAAMPGVQSVAYARRLPFGWDGSGMTDVQSADKAVRQASWNAVSPGFFATLGIPIVRGRAFQETDPPCGKGSCSVVISESLAREFLPGVNPIGKTLRTPRGSIYEVVGVARDTSTLRVGQADGPLIYFPWNANAAPHSLLARFTGDGAPLAQAITATIRGMVRELLVDTRTVQSRIDERVEGFWKLESLVKILGSIAAAMAIIGVYGLVSFAVSQRTREMGVRIALGARPQDIFRAALSSSLRPIAAGLLIGLLLAFAAAKLLARVTQFSRDMLFTVNAHDLLAYGVATALLAAVIFAAMLGPARRAMKVDPMVALRDE